jgi:protoporphyrinogen oxidase
MEQIAMSALPSIAILGAGPAGLGLAYRLSLRRKFDVTVLERGQTVGGNAGSFELCGLRVDYGSHRLHPSCSPEILADMQEFLGADLLDRPRHGRIRLRDR